MSTPPTSYMLDMIKALYINNADPTKMNKDPVQGLKEKENDLKKLTHEYLQKTIPDYEQQEAQIAATMGSKITDLMLGLMDPEELSQKPPTIVFSNFEPYSGSSSSSSSSGTPDSNIYSNKQYYLDSVISGGNMNMTEFTYEWSILKKPTPGNVSFIEYSNISVPTQWNLSTLIEFSDSGSYVIQLKVTSSVYTDITSVLSTSATVISTFNLEII